MSSSEQRDRLSGSFSAQDATNSSNAIFENVPERLERSSAPRQPSDATVDDGPQKEPSKSTGSKLMAASALTSLVNPPANEESSEEKEDEEEDEEFVIPQRFTKSGRKRATRFPLKLMQVLSSKEYADIITWLPDGKSFTIIRPKVFVAEILPTHFKQAKYSSFTRKLHRWGFQRHLRGEEAGAFFHEQFQRDRLDLVEEMTCSKTETSPAASASATPKPPRVTFREPILSQSTNRLVRPPSSLRPTTEQLLLAEAEAIRRQQQLNRVSMNRPESMSVGPMNAAGRLNAAIELEVSRRLKERIQAAALSRQALAMMQQQIQPQISLDRGMGWNGTASSARSSPGLGLSQLMNKNYVARFSEVAALRHQLGLNDQNLSFLPPTNIQGAKTA